MLGGDFVELADDGRFIFDGGFDLGYELGVCLIMEMSNEILSERGVCVTTELSELEDSRLIYCREGKAKCRISLHTA